MAKGPSLDPLVEWRYATVGLIECFTRFMDSNVARLLKSIRYSRVEASLGSAIQIQRHTWLVQQLEVSMHATWESTCMAIHDSISCLMKSNLIQKPRILFHFDTNPNLIVPEIPFSIRNPLCDSNPRKSKSHTNPNSNPRGIGSDVYRIEVQTFSRHDKDV